MDVTEEQRKEMKRAWDVNPDTIETTPTIGVVLVTGRLYNGKYWAELSSGDESVQSNGNNQNTVIGSVFWKLYKANGLTVTKP